MKNIFVIVLRYLVPIEDIDPHRPKHLEFLDEHYKAGRFIASGRQVPASGGVILARGSSRKEIEDITKNDPFAIHSLAEYQIFEFVPNKYSKEFEGVMLHDK
jgi:uncharacterized protein YciI